MTADCGKMPRRDMTGGKCEFRELMKVQKKFCNYVYGVRSLVETDATKLVYQLQVPAENLPGALDARWITWIRLFDFDVKHHPEILNRCPDGLSWWPQGEEVPGPDVENDPEETIQARL